MITRTIEISNAPVHLCIRLEQLVLQRDGQPVAHVPLEDVGIVVVDHPQSSYSHAALASLASVRAVMIVCDEKHLPCGILLPLAQHSQIASRIQDQAAAPAPLKKRLWRQIVQEKIRQQAANLEVGSSAHRRLLELAREVRSGDATNCEAQAAKVYWSSWLPQGAFRRRPQGDSPNGLLNYGYAVLRAAVARALVAAGLTPALGLHHTHRANAFCLADDLMEPLRPLVDERVRALYLDGRVMVDRKAKEELLGLLSLRTETAGQTGPLLVTLHRYAASLAQCLEGTRKRLEIPVRCKLADTDACGLS